MLRPPEPVDIKGELMKLLEVQLVAEPSEK